MNGIVKKKRIKQGEKLNAKKQKRWYMNHDDMAMISAGVDISEWGRLPDHVKQLHRLRARQALSVFGES